MDFIESWFGVSPDGGSGSFEALVILAMVSVAGIAIFRRPLGRWIAGGFQRLSGVRSGERVEVVDVTQTTKAPQPIA